VSNALDGYPVVIELPVQWGEQDAFGHVNNIYYFRWCETARIVYLNKVGLGEPVGGQGLGPIVASISCNFRQPVEYPDTVRVGTRVTRIGNSSFVMTHLIVSDALGVVADSESTLVVLDYGAGKPERVPDGIRAAIAALEQNPELK
jgi:acyl-CoA thioester hydrolase